MARADAASGLLMTTPAVGNRGADLCLRHRRSGPVPVVAAGRCPFRADAEEVPVRRDRRHRSHLKIGDAAVREALYEAANVMLTRPVKGSSPEELGDAVARRAGMRKAKVALARKLAVILHRMLADGKAFNPVASAKT